MYTVQYFKQKFSAIPDRLWTINLFKRRRGLEIAHCALGWCGYDNSISNSSVEEGMALIALFRKYIPRVIVFEGNSSYQWSPEVPTINDHKTDLFPQKKPKARILAALDYIEQRQREEAVKNGEAILDTVKEIKQAMIDEYIMNSIELVDD